MAEGNFTYCCNNEKQWWHAGEGLNSITGYQVLHQGLEAKSKKCEKWMVGWIPS